MTTRGRASSRPRQVAGTTRVGLFGKLGSGNIGNDASMEAVLAYLRAHHPEATLDAMCGRPEKVTGRYGVAAVPLHWYQRHEHASGATAIVLKVAGRVVDAFRTASWVRRHDVVIVPGMGVLEASLPLRPWQFPYAMFLLGLSGRLFGTKVALVSVGADVINQRLTRWLSISAARLAFFRSYRDVMSRDAMRQQGVDTTHDHVYPDLVFALPAPPSDPGDARTVGVGVMEYRGGNDDRKHADEIYNSYVASIKEFVRWLVDGGRRVRLFVGDANGSDDGVVQEILADLRTCRPDLDPAMVIAEPVTSAAELTRAIAPAATVVATRYHNVLYALKLAKPTISIGYSGKHDTLMTDMGLSEYCLSASSLDTAQLIDRFKRLEYHSVRLRQTLIERNAVNTRLLDEQFAELSASLFPEVRLPGAATDGRAQREPSLGHESE